MIEMTKVGGEGEVEAVAALAREIWNEHFVPIIGLAQVEYMLERFQSARAIRGQMAEGYEYYLVTDAGRRVGYFAVVPRPDEHAAQLSKIYLLRAARGRGLGRAILGFVEAYCAERGIEKLWLTVNRHNAGSIAFYKRMGFTHERDVVQDIGEGFAMDDYRMAKRVARERTQRGDGPQPNEINH